MRGRRECHRGVLAGRQGGMQGAGSGCCFKKKKKKKTILKINQSWPGRDRCSSAKRSRDRWRAQTGGSTLNGCGHPGGTWVGMGSRLGVPGALTGRAGCPDPPGGSLLPAGLQTVLPPHLRERFVAAALSYIACGSAGELLCRRSDCRCQCQPAFPHCNCPEADVQALEGSLAQLHRAWESHHGQFEESGEAGGKLPGCSDPDPKATLCLKPSSQP